MILVVQTLVGVSLWCSTQALVEGQEDFFDEPVFSKHGRRPCWKRLGSPRAAGGRM